METADNQQITTLSNLLKKEDYETIGHTVILKNETSGIDYLNCKKINIKEISKDSISLELPNHVCQHGHKLAILLLNKKIEKQYEKFPNITPNQGVLITGKVVYFNNDHNEPKYPKNAKNTIIEIELKLPIDSNWKKILSHYEGIQKKISTLTNRVKK